MLPSYLQKRLNFNGAEIILLHDFGRDGEQPRLKKVMSSDKGQLENATGE